MSARATLSACSALALALAGAACEPMSPPSADAAPAVAQQQAPEPWTWSDEEVVEAVDDVRAGRDLNPDSWPNGARVAVALSFDADNETLALRTGNTSPGALSQGEYGARVGLRRVLALLDRHQIPASFFIPAMSLHLAPHMVDMIKASGRHEFGVHGWIHEGNSTLPEAVERDLLQRAVARVEEMTGTRPVGYRAPSWDMSPATLRIVKELGFTYESSLMADDRPYELVSEGQPTGIVELPVEWILDDAPLFDPRGQRYESPREVMQVWIDEFDQAYEEGTLFLLTTHPHIIGHRSRMAALEGLIDHIRSKPGVWFATHRQVAEYVKSRAGMM